MKLLIALLMMSSTPQGGIYLVLEPTPQTVMVGDTINIGLIATSKNLNVPFSGAQVLFTWEPEYLEFMGLDDTGAVPLELTGIFQEDYFGINESDIPKDGDAQYIGAPLPMIDAADILLTTLVFEAQQKIDSTFVSIVPEIQKPGKVLATTEVFNGIAGLDVWRRNEAIVDVKVMPEPTTVALLLGGMALLRRRM